MRRSASGVAGLFFASISALRCLSFALAIAFFFLSPAPLKVIPRFPCSIGVSVEGCCPERELGVFLFLCLLVDFAPSQGLGVGFAGGGLTGLGAAAFAPTEPFLVFIFLEIKSPTPRATAVPAPTAIALPLPSSEER